MCGIAGIVAPPDRSPPTRATLEAMGDAIQHRGPDGHGVHRRGAIGFVHRRLAIVDLEAGVQPMQRTEGGPVIVYNGELYNFDELTRELTAAGVTLKTHSDTELVLAAYEVFGEECVHHLRGMFAFAIDDPRENRVFLARDRFGIKPLYYAHTAEGFTFASELSALRVADTVECKPDPVAIRDLLLFQFISGPRTIYKGVERLQPGHTLTLRPGEAPRIRRFWQLEPGARSPLQELSMDDAAARIGELFQETVRSHLIADVPLGALLSGGVDSSFVVSMMRRATDVPVQTFTVKFETKDPKYDEAHWAALVAKELGTQHHEVLVTESELMSEARRIAKVSDEPLADPALVPTYLVCRFARERVKVVLTGEGADELFAGYPRYRLHKRLRMLTGEPKTWYRPTFVFGQHELVRLLADDGIQQLFSDPVPQFYSRFADDFTNSLLYSELVTSLPDDLLMKVDKASMLTSLEARVPYLDHAFAEQIMPLPGSWKLRGSSLKHILKLACQGAVPESVLTRKKHGFTLPIKEWVRRESVQKEMREVFADSVLVSLGILDRRALNRFVPKAFKRKRDARKLWTLFTLELWLDHNVRARA